MTPSIICGKRASICLWHPSPTAEIAISAACLNNKKIYIFIHTINKSRNIKFNYSTNLKKDVCLYNYSSHII